MSVSQTLRDEWRNVIRKILNDILDKLLNHPDMVACRQRLEDEYNAEHADTIQALATLDVLYDTWNEEERQYNLQRAVLKDLLGGAHPYNPNEAHKVFAQQRDGTVQKLLKAQLSVHHDLSQQYRKCHEMEETLSLRLLMANTPSTLQAAMTALCKELGVTLPGQT